MNNYFGYYTIITAEPGDYFLTLPLYNILSLILRSFLYQNSRLSYLENSKQIFSTMTKQYSKDFAIVTTA